MNYNAVAQTLFNKEYENLTDKEMFQVIDAVEMDKLKINKEKVNIIKIMGRFDIEDVEILTKAMREIDERKLERTVFSTFLDCDCIKKFQTKKDFENYYISKYNIKDRKIIFSFIPKKNRKEK